nr:unnamed protein product [Spirometra erinaceieuropaei]
MSVESSVLDTNSTANFPSLCNESQLNTFSIDYECPSTSLEASFASLNRKTHSPGAEVQSDSQTEGGRRQGSGCHLETQTGPSNQTSTRSLFRRKQHILYPMACYIDRNRPETPTKASRQADFKAQLDQQMEIHLAARRAMQEYLCQLESLEAEAVNQDLSQIPLNKNREKLEKQADYKTALDYQIDLGSTSSSIY